MGDTVLMHVNDSFCDFLDFSGCIVVLKFFIFFQDRVKSTFFHVIEDEVNALSVVEESMKGEDILIEHEGLKFEFQDKLVNHVMAFDN